MQCIVTPFFDKRNTLQDRLRVKRDKLLLLEQNRAKSSMDMTEYQFRRRDLHTEYLVLEKTTREPREAHPGGDCLFSSLSTITRYDAHLLRALVVGTARLSPKMENQQGMQA